MTTPTLPRPLQIAALTAAFAVMSNTAWAGPRVGSTVGVPSTATTTVNAKVISATPVIAQVATPRQACYDELQSVAPRSSGAGAIIGAIAGAALGNAVGKGAGRAVATGVGLIGGAVLGDHVENDGRPGTTRSVRRCEQQSVYENQVVAYSVVYEVGGQRYTTQLPQEPGPTIPVQLTVSPAVVQAPQAVSYTPPPSPMPVVDYQVQNPAVIEVYEDRPYRHRHHWRHWD